MPISVQCPRCGKKLSAKDDMAGKNATCPACKQVMVIPAVYPAPPAPPQPPHSPGQVAPPPPLPSGSWSGTKAKWTAVKDGLKRREEVIERKAVASNFRREINSLQAALEGQFEKLGSLTLTHRPPVVDVSAEVTELSQIDGETTQKQALLESLRQTTGSAPVVKEVDQELAALQYRKRTTTIQIGSKTAIARPEMPGTVGLYAAIDRLRMSLTAKQNELKTIEEQVGTQGADWGMDLPVTKLATFAGAIAGGTLLFYLLFMRSPRTHSFSNFGWLVVLGAVAFVIYLVRLGNAAEARGM